jgi:hypothetical protein
MTMGLGVVAGATGFAALPDGVASAAEPSPSLLPPEAKSLQELTARLSRAPRRRDFKTVPIAAGKTRVSRCLEGRGFSYARESQSITVRSE